MSWTETWIIHWYFVLTRPLGKCISAFLSFLLFAQRHVSWNILFRLFWNHGSSVRSAMLLCNIQILCIKWLVFHLLKYRNFLFIGMLLELVQNNPENQVYLLSSGCISQVSDLKPSNLVTKERWRVMNSTSWMRAFHGGSRRRSLTHKIVVESLTQLLLLLRRLHAILAPSQSRSRRAMWAQASSGRRLHEWSPLVLGWKATFCLVKRSWCD